MRRSDIVLVYFDPTDGLRHCRICCDNFDSYIICSTCVKQDDRKNRCCSYSSPQKGNWSKNFKFDNTIHTILVSTNYCNLIPNCTKKEKCPFFKQLGNIHKSMENIKEE